MDEKLRDRMVLTRVGMEGMDMGNLGMAASESRELVVMATAKDNRHKVKIMERMVRQHGGGRGEEDFE